MFKVDIVGGSISGLSTAITLKSKNPNIKVNIYEKHKKIGYNFDGRRCGEAFNIYNELLKWIPSESSIFNDITNAEYTFGNVQYHTVENDLSIKWVILNRQKYIAKLGEKAIELGVNINTNSKIRSYKDLQGDYIVDASGCPSVIRRELGFKKGIYAKSYQQTIQDSNYFNNNTIRIVFDEVFGYYWIFPRDPNKKEIKVGVGSAIHTSNLKKKIELFKEKMNISGSINEISGGLIPIGLQKPLKYKNILFVGDAGVGTYFFTGEGIYRALISGEIAGNCIAYNKASSYPYLTKKQFIKWDIIGKTLRMLGYFLQKINPEFFLSHQRIIFEYLYLKVFDVKYEKTICKM